MNETKANEALAKLISVFQETKLTVGEILIVYGNLGYALGASIEGYQEKGPSIEELKRLYYSQPSVGIAMMLQGITVTSWYESWAEQLKNQGNDL